MSKADDVVRLRHMLDAAHKAVELTENSERADLDKDEKLTLALLRLLEVLGEAAGMFLTSTAKSIRKFRGNRLQEPGTA